MKPKPLTEVKAYSDFIRSRDLGLERMLTRYQRSLSQIVAGLEQRALEIASHMTVSAPQAYQMKAKRQEFERRLRPWFEIATQEAFKLVSRLRTSTHLLSYLGQARAASSSLDQKIRVKLTLKTIQTRKGHDAPSGGDLKARVELAFHRLERKVIDAFQLSQVMESPTSEILDRLRRAFPATKTIKKVKAPLAKMKESRLDLKILAPEDLPEWLGDTIDFEQEWKGALEDYFEEYLPLDRSDAQFLFADAESEGISEWELEREMTNDFIESVRAGENEAAKDQGVEDFVWLAIIDNQTDSCCAIRDGLLISEIESKVSAGEDMGDCDATETPAHPNCRCRLAPATEDLPQEEPTDFGSFDEFLKSKE